ncbi:unnamed protein product, partial [Iphiclides podalirius]
MPVSDVRAATLSRVINLQIGSLADGPPRAMDAAAISKNTKAIAAKRPENGNDEGKKISPDLHEGSEHERRKPIECQQPIWLRVYVYVNADFAPGSAAALKRKHEPRDLQTSTARGRECAAHETTSLQLDAVSFRARDISFGQKAIFHTAAGGWKPSEVF